MLLYLLNGLKQTEDNSFKHQFYEDDQIEML